jgi:hypothetical protein
MVCYVRSVQRGCVGVSLGWRWGSSSVGQSAKLGARQCLRRKKEASTLSPRGALTRMTDGVWGSRWRRRRERRAARCCVTGGHECMLLAVNRKERKAPCVVQRKTQSRPRAMSLARPAVPARLLVWGLDFGRKPASHFEKQASDAQASRSANLRQAGSRTLAGCCSSPCARCHHSLLPAFCTVSRSVALRSFLAPTQLIPTLTLLRQSPTSRLPSQPISTSYDTLPASPRQPFPCQRRPTTVPSQPQHRRYQDIARCLATLDCNTPLSADHTAHSDIHNGSLRETASSYVSPYSTTPHVVGVSASNNARRPRALPSGAALHTPREALNLH